mmetsp:Transcript_66961/g.205056  ORF Transcript_66961/g.205056 Transcript_66961/m.205056 type:complete len:288 (+) Transcript_66961:972-1835(+)
MVNRELHDLGAHAVHEVLGVRRQDDGRRVVRQVLLEPHAGPEVQVVGGLVQDQQRRFFEQGLRQRDAHAPAARHVLRRLGHHLLREAEAVEEAPRLRLESLGAHPVQLVAQHLEEVGVALGVVLAQLLDELLEPLVLLGGDVDHALERRLVRRIGLLVHEPRIDVGGDRQLPRGQARQQGRLAAAVGTDEAVAPAVVDADGRVLDEFLAEHRHVHLLEPHVPRLVARSQHASDVHRVEHREAAAPLAQDHVLLPCILSPFRQDLLALLFRRSLGGRLGSLCGAAHGW